MTNTKHISAGLTLARQTEADNAEKSVTVRILDHQSDAGIRSTVVIAGKFTSPGDIADVTESEAADLVSRGRAELVTD